MNPDNNYDDKLSAEDIAEWAYAHFKLGEICPIALLADSS